MVRIHTEPPAVRNQVVMRFGNSRPQLSVRRLGRIRMKWHDVKRREPHANRKPRRNRANTLDNFSQKSRTVLEASAVWPLPRMRAQEFVPQVSVAMLDVHKVETQFTRHFCRAMKLFDDRADFSVRQERIIAGQPQFSIQNRVMIKDAWFRLVARIRTAVSPGMRQLQSDEQPFVRTRRSPVLFDQHLSQSRQSLSRVLSDNELIRIRAPLVRNCDRLTSPN